MKEKDKKNESKKNKKNNKKDNERKNKTDINFNDLFLSYEEINIDHELIKDYDENKSLIFI